MVLALNKSLALYNRAMEIIPNGTGTFSKSRTSYIPGEMPLYAEGGWGAYLHDVDSNIYLDFVSGLCSSILGYCDQDVDIAVIEQIKKGVNLSLPSRLEIDVAELICRMVPSAEMVRFSKNGSDSTMGAIRLARAYTGRDHVAYCGYHGWSDAVMINPPRNHGVPESVRKLSHTFDYNDIESLYRLFDEYNDSIACVMMEPANYKIPLNGFLNEVKELCHKNKSIFILDECITGFRFARGGAQEYFDVIPDITCLAKAIANGYPLSAIAGRADIMELIGDPQKVHFSFTYSSECVSLAASLATLTKINNNPVNDTINARGKQFIDGMSNILSGTDYFMGGHQSWPWLLLHDVQKAIVAHRELINHGIMVNRAGDKISHNLTYSHSVDNIDRLLDAYREVIPMLNDISFDTVNNGVVIR